ncbi:dienelactone hydrolase family protein [Rubellimicrobium aerolatum]|uniref:Dienelactone hydrolase family protein n=1 Tax=Rubellimicrobium aerolatum TaxID=490979 RepID=A0ABW0SAS4_9RHOB|nr:dienelactone hydrolase family protein [Rubellimicrobium aerolatum]MBP1805332.1 dienelactone hydrolase [Rubellimicrobium aerolatum]
MRWADALGGIRALPLLLLLAACGPAATVAPPAREAGLALHWRLLRPDGPGPHPAAVLLPGCDGVHDNMDFWAETFLRHGRAALILDSHAPRGLDDDPAWRLVCAAQLLRGPERAGDLAVALDALDRMPGIDGGDVVLLGASHGGWTAMEFVRLAAEGTPPPGLARWPASPDDLLARTRALVLLYPYCGVLNRAGPEDWAEAPPTLMILAGDDSVVSAPACADRARQLAASGAEVRVEVLPGAGHAFDQRDRSPLSALTFDADQRARAEALVGGLLGDLR